MRKIIFLIVKLVIAIGLFVLIITGGSITENIIGIACLIPTLLGSAIVYYYYALKKGIITEEEYESVVITISLGLSICMIIAVLFLSYGSIKCIP